MSQPPLAWGVGTKQLGMGRVNIMTDNEALAIKLEISNNQNLTLATIDYPNGNPDLSLFQTINNLSDNVMFVGDFNSKLESFGCTKKNTSGPMLKNIQKQPNLIYFMMSTRIWTDQMVTLTY